ncbi:unnamed protein product [Hapterophycus canaliculatus]
MLCNSAHRSASRIAGCKERSTLVVIRSVSAAGTGGGREKSKARRWRSPTAGGAWEGQGQRRLASMEVAPAAHGMTLNVDEKVHRVKHRVPQKRASFLLNELREEQRNAERCELPDIRTGDAIEVTMFANKNAGRTTQVRGVLVRKVNKGIDSTILLRDVINGNSVEHHIPLFSPLLQSIEVMERAFIYQGKLKGKRVRPSRIYYIRNLDQKFYRITGGGGSDN